MLVLVLDWGAEDAAAVGVGRGEEEGVGCRGQQEEADAQAAEEEGA